MRHDNRGFSLIELMIVVAIMGIIAAIAIPAYIGIQKKGKRVEYKTNLEILRLLQEKRHAETGEYAGEAADTLAVKGVFPEFQPGDLADLLYEYSVTSVDPALDFSVTATGKAGTSDAGKKFCINERNEKTCP